MGAVFYLDQSTGTATFAGSKQQSVWQKIHYIVHFVAAVGMKLKF
jgi:hypothetical protein